MIYMKLFYDIMWLWGKTHNQGTSAGKARYGRKYDRLSI